jgi:hypothetical protein
MSMDINNSKCFSDDVKFLFRVFEGGNESAVGMSSFLMRLDFNGWIRSH